MEAANPAIVFWVFTGLGCLIGGLFGAYAVSSFRLHSVEAELAAAWQANAILAQKVNEMVAANRSDIARNP